MRYIALATLAVLFSFPASSQSLFLGDGSGSLPPTARGEPQFPGSNQPGRLQFPPLSYDAFPAKANRAKVTSRIYPSTETYDFREGGGQYCEPSTDFQWNLDWPNGSCVDVDGLERRFIETRGRGNWGDVVYFKCDNFGVSLRGLITERHRYGIGNPDHGEPVDTRVVLNGREVGSYSGHLPNVFIAGDIRHIPTDEGESLLEKLRSGSEGKLKLETSQDGRPQNWDYTFSLRGFKRAIDWCTAVIDSPVSESAQEILLSAAD